MSFHNILFPEDLSYGTRGGQGFSTSIKMSDSGVESRSGEWERNRGRIQYDVAKSVQTPDEMAALLDFFVCMRGSACGFRFKDPTDFTSAEDGVTSPSTIADAHVATRVYPAGRTYQIQKLYKNPYTAGSDPAQYRTITRPIQPGNADHNVRVYIDGALVWKSDSTSAGTQAQGFVAAVDYDTGRILFNKTPGGTVKVACTFHVPVRFGQEIDDGLEISWDAAGHFSIATVPIVELTADPPTDSEEWWDGGHVDYGNPPNALGTGIGAMWFKRPEDQQRTYMHKFTITSSQTIYLGQFHATGTVKGHRLYPPTKFPGENFTGGPYNMIVADCPARRLNIYALDRNGGGISTLSEHLDDDEYAEYYWLGDTTGFKSR